MHAFVAINIAMGFNQSPESKNTWSVNPIVQNGFISSFMRRTRHRKLSQYKQSLIYEVVFFGLCEKYA